MTTEIPAPEIDEEDEAPEHSDVQLPDGRYVDQDHQEAWRAAVDEVRRQSPIASLLARSPESRLDFIVERNGPRYSVRFSPCGDPGQISEEIEWIVTPKPEGWKVERA